MNATIPASPYLKYVPAARATFMGREIGRCPGCKRVIVRDSMFWSGSRVKCDCGADVTLKGIWGRESAKECNDRCTGATGPACDCSCGGRNHGGGHL